MLYIVIIGLWNTDLSNSIQSQPYKLHAGVLPHPVLHLDSILNGSVLKL